MTCIGVVPIVIRMKVGGCGLQQMFAFGDCSLFTPVASDYAQIWSSFSWKYNQLLIKKVFNTVTLNLVTNSSSCSLKSDLMT